MMFLQDRAVVSILFVFVCSPLPCLSARERAAVPTNDERFVVQIPHEHLQFETTTGFDPCSCDAEGAILFLTRREIDVLKTPHTVVGSLRDYVRAFLPTRTMATVGVPSVSKILGEPAPVFPAADVAAGTGFLDYDRYHTPAEGQFFYLNLASSHPHIARTVSIGTSVEGRDILAMKISDNPDLDEREEQAVLFCGVHHAREWVTHEMMLYLADYLVSRYDADPRVRHIVDRSEVWLVPVVNPDGFEFSWTDERFWRKNRRFNGNDGNGNPVYGVDLNRNYDYRWGPGGSSGFIFSETYRGPSAASEPETQAMQALIGEQKPAVAVTYHTYSQLVLYPWGYSSAITAQSYTSMRALGDAYAARARRTHGFTYTPGPTNYTIYPTTGDFCDYAYGAQGAMAFTPEMRPASSNLGGFLLPENQLLANHRENLAAALHLMDNVANAAFLAIPSTGLLFPGTNDFSLPFTPVNQKPELALGMDATTTGFLSTWLSDLMHIDSDFYGFPQDWEAVGCGSVYRFEHLPLSAPWADSFSGYEALPHVFDDGAVVMIESFGSFIPNYVGVPFDHSVRMRDLRLYKREIVELDNTFGLRENVLESRTALEDLSAADPWISWRWIHREADGDVIVAHPLGENGAEEWLHPFLGYSFTVNVPSYSFGQLPVYLLVFPRPIRADGNDDNLVDEQDYRLFQSCLAGPVHVELSTPCAAFDFDHDFDVDMCDFDLLQQQYGMNGG